MKPAQFRHHQREKEIKNLDARANAKSRSCSVGFAPNGSSAIECISALSKGTNKSRKKSVRKVCSGIWQSFDCPTKLQRKWGNFKMWKSSRQKKNKEKKLGLTWTRNTRLTVSLPPRLPYVYVRTYVRTRIGIVLILEGWVVKRVD